MQLSEANNPNTYQLMHLSSVLFNIINLVLQMQNFIFQLHHPVSVESNRISLSSLELFSNNKYIKVFLRQILQKYSRYIDISQWSCIKAIALPTFGSLFANHYQAQPSEKKEEIFLCSHFPYRLTFMRVTKTT